MFIDFQRAVKSIKRNELIKAVIKRKIATKRIGLVEMTMKTTNNSKNSSRRNKQIYNKYVDDVAIITK